MNQLTIEQIRIKSNEYLSSLGVEVPDHLPMIECLENVVPRSAEDIASRLCAIAYVIGLGYDANSEILVKHLNKYHLMPHVSDYEQGLLFQGNITEQDKINMTWLCESAQALAWSINLVELDHFTHCDDDLASKIPFETDPSDFIQSAKRRPISEIQEQTDLLYRMHWFARHWRLSGKETSLSESIVSERRKAIDWVYGVAENWDDIPMDT